MDKSMHKDFGIQIFITEKLGQKDVHCTSRQMIYSWTEKSVHENFGTQIFITEKLGQKD